MVWIINTLLVVMTMTNDIDYYVIVFKFGAKNMMTMKLRSYVQGGGLAHQHELEKITNLMFSPLI